MQNNGNFEKIIRTAPRKPHKPDNSGYNGKTWKREDKRKVFSQQ